ITLMGSGAPASPQVTRNRAYSASVAPRPPYSAGQCTPIQPPSCRTRCQARRRSNASPSAPVGSASGSLLNSSVRLRSSQRRSSSRNGTSSGSAARSARSCTALLAVPASRGEPLVLVALDDVPLDLVGPASEAEHPRIAEHRLDGRALLVAEAAEDLHGGVADEEALLAAEQLGDR